MTNENSNSNERSYFKDKSKFRVQKKINILNTDLIFDI